MPYKLASKEIIFAGLGITTDQEACRHICAILGVFLTEEGVTDPEHALNRQRFRETLRIDITSPNASRLGVSVQPLFRKDPDKCIEALYQLACYVKKNPSFYRRIDMSPVVLFPRITINGIPNSDLHINRASWPRKPMYGYRLQDLLQREGNRRMISADEKWIDRTCLSFNMLLSGLTHPNFHAFDPHQEALLWSRDDPASFTRSQHGHRLPGEEIVTRENYFGILENAIGEFYDGHTPRWPTPVTRRPKIFFIIRPRDQLRESGQCIYLVTDGL